MHKDFKGEAIYQAEVDVHFPQLTVGQTLGFAAEARAPANRPPGVTREQYATHCRDVVMAVFGLSHTINTKVGNDFGAFGSPDPAGLKADYYSARSVWRRAQTCQYCGGSIGRQPAPVLGQQHKRVG